MKPEEQRIAIAVICGWEPERTWLLAPNRMCGERPEDGCYMPLPDYPNDLNAMHEAEKVLWEIDWNNRHVFNDNLANILKGRTVNRNEWYAETLLDATAAQRAEAFLKTLNLWKS